jgi:hypothetical protein
MIRFLLVSGLIFIFTQNSFGELTQTPTPASVCDQCTNQALANDLAADYGVKNTDTLEDALTEKLWKDKIRGNVVPVGMKEFDLGIAKTLSESQIMNFLRNYSQAQLFVIATKIITPGSNEIVENCYKTCSNFNDEMLSLYEGREANQFEPELLKIGLIAYSDLAEVDPEYENPSISSDRNVRVLMGLDIGVTVQVTKQNLSAIESDGDTKILTLFDGKLITKSDILYKFELDDPNKPGVLVVHFLNESLNPLCGPTQDDNRPKVFQVIFPPRFAPTPESSSKS